MEGFVVRIIGSNLSFLAVPMKRHSLLRAVRAAIESITIEFNATTFEDPISWLRFGLKGI
jgi:hypothetical protein